jgi:hypothetical protein
MNGFGYDSGMALYLKLPKAETQHTFNHQRWEELLASGGREIREVIHDRDQALGGQQGLDQLRR